MVCLWCVYGVPMVCLRCVYGMPMVCLWCVYCVYVPTKGNAEQNDRDLLLRFLLHFRRISIEGTRAVLLHLSQEHRRRQTRWEWGWGCAPY